MPSMEIQSVYLTPKALRGANISLDRKSQLMSAAAVAVDCLLEYYKEHMDNQELLDNMERERNLLKEETIEKLTAEEIDSRVFTLGTYVKKLFLAGEAKGIWKFRQDQQKLKTDESNRKERKYEEQQTDATMKAKRRSVTRQSIRLLRRSRRVLAPSLSRMHQTLPLSRSATTSQYRLKAQSLRYQSSSKQYWPSVLLLRYLRL